MGDLHARLLARCDHLSDVHRALRAVVELHKPVDRGYAVYCEGCDEPEQPEGAGWPPWPCSTIRVIADALGVKDVIEEEKTA